MRKKIIRWVDSLQERQYKAIQVIVGVLLGILAGLSVILLGNVDRLEFSGMSIGVIICGATLNIAQKTIKRSTRLLVIANFVTVFIIFVGFVLWRVMY